MRIKSFVLGGAALLSVAALSAPALAYTHHPSTKAERKQTDDLNAQALAKAQGQEPMQQQAANTAMPAANTAMPEQQNNAMTTTPQPNAAPADQQNQNQQDSTKPAQPSDQNAQTPQSPTPQPSPQQ